MLGRGGLQPRDAVGEPVAHRGEHVGCDAAERGFGVDQAHEVLERQRTQAAVADVFTCHKN